MPGTSAEPGTLLAHIEAYMRAANPPPPSPGTLFTLPPEIRELIYDHLDVGPFYFRKDIQHPRARWFSSIRRLPFLSPPFTIPDWTFTVDANPYFESHASIHAMMFLGSTCTQLREELFSPRHFDYSRYTFTFRNDSVYLPKVRAFLAAIGYKNRRVLGPVVVNFTEDQGLPHRSALAEYAREGIELVVCRGERRFVYGFSNVGNLVIRRIEQM